jgi:deferrochelatase/peroxidase EfeB
MSSQDKDGFRAGRRGFLTKAGLAAVAGTTLGPGAALEAKADARQNAAPDTLGQIEPFWGTHQGGITTRAQSHTYFAAFDLTTTQRDDVIKLLKAWTAASARLAAGMPIEAFEETTLDYGTADTYATTTTTTTDDEPKTVTVAAPDSGEAIGLPAARLTLTFGFGATLFSKDGKDRYGLAQQRPQALVDLPNFVGDQLVPEHTAGDLSVQACADDPQVAFHAVRQLARLAENVAQLRWAQTGFMPHFAGKDTPRNLMGFKDGTNNPSIHDPKSMEQFVWVGSEGPDWMQGGSYVVARRIRIALEHWDRSKVSFQEQTVGRHKVSGAPLGEKNEFTPLNLKAVDKDGNPIIAENSHVRLAAAESNGGAQILRRPYSYNDGVNFTAERWPPWRQGMEYDAGLLFVCYQRDPRTGFIKIFENMAKLDMMNQFVTHVGGGMYACPRGVAPGEFIGQRLFA